MGNVEYVKSDVYLIPKTLNYLSLVKSNKPIGHLSQVSS